MWLSSSCSQPWITLKRKVSGLVCCLELNGSEWDCEKYLQLWYIHVKIVPIKGLTTGKNIAKTQIMLELSLLCHVLMTLNSQIVAFTYLNYTGSRVFIYITSFSRRYSCCISTVYLYCFLIWYHFNLLLMVT